MNNKDEIVLNTRLHKEDAAGIIEALAEALKEGHLDVKKSGESLKMDVPELISLDIEACKNSQKSFLSIKVSWDSQEIIKA